MSREMLSPADISASACIIHEAFGTVTDEFGLTPDNCPANPACITDKKNWLTCSHAASDTSGCLLAAGRSVW
jgi:hypothetical protein